MKNIFFCRELRFVCILIFLFIFSVFISFLLQNDSPFFLRVDDNNLNNIYPTNNYQELKKGEIVGGELKSKFSYLGIVSVRFNTFNRINDDILIFRIKEKGKSQWYYENKYKTNQFQDGQLFPFGFPTIAESNGRTYAFEIESLRGKKGDAIALGSKSPLISTVFQYSYGRFDSLGSEGLRFIESKYINGFTDVARGIAILSPFLIYFFVKILIRSLKSVGYFVTRMQMIFAALLFVSLFYIILLGRVLPGDRVNNDQVTILLLIGWIAFVLKYKIQSIIWFVFACFSLFLVTIILILIKRPDFADRAATLAYWFLIIGVIHGFIEYFFNQQNATNANDFLFELLPIKQLVKVVQSLISRF